MAQRFHESVLEAPHTIVTFGRTRDAPIKAFSTIDGFDDVEKGDVACRLVQLEPAPRSLSATENLGVDEKGEDLECVFTRQSNIAAEISAQNILVTADRTLRQFVAPHGNFGHDTNGVITGMRNKYGCSSLALPLGSW